ncbi:MAG: hypothetical protein HOW73_05185 [Polyangiaceae bacterium]|nr:hypothetical protein [Polyangiaceae bacterium]
MEMVRMLSRRRGLVLTALTLSFAITGCKVTSNGDGDGDGDDGEGGGDNNASVAPFFLPTGEPDNTSAPTVEVDSEGGIHAVYPAYAGGNAYYAYCAADCSGADDVAVVELPTEGTTANAMIALDGNGRPQVLLSTFSKVYYAAPNGDPTDAASWRMAIVLDHDSEKEVTGEAFALDSEGRPRFMMHTYVAYLGIGQDAPETHYVTCDSDCFDAASWHAYKVADQIWQSSKLQFGDDGSIHLATVASVADENGLTTDIGAYVRCNGNCTAAESWVGTGLMPAYSSEVEAVQMRPAMTMDLTSDAKPRIAMISDASGSKNLVYFECNGDCTDPNAWAGTILLDGSEIGPGVDLALDNEDRPRIAHTFNYNIGIAHCSTASCTAESSPWDVATVEISSDMDPDEIFLWDNCNVAAWFLHTPSIALDAGGNPRVGYQARDISGGWSNPDPNKPDCVAGTDMTWSRLAVMQNLLAGAL